MTAADRARAERAAQGLDPVVTDPLAYRDLAVLLKTSDGAVVPPAPAVPSVPSSSPPTRVDDAA